MNLQRLKELVAEELEDSYSVTGPSETAVQNKLWEIYESLPELLAYIKSLEKKVEACTCEEEDFFVCSNHSPHGYESCCDCSPGRPCTESLS